MVDTARAGFPSEMFAAANGGEMGALGDTAEHLIESATRYVQEQPVKAVFWALGIGFVLGWRLKPW